MTIKQWLRRSTEFLKESGIGTARLDCLILLEDAMGKNRSWLLTNFEQIISPKQINSLKISLDRRARHEPLAYIRQKTEFYGREFFVDRRVLEPRPESETMIEILLGLVESSEDFGFRTIRSSNEDSVRKVKSSEPLGAVVDVGTGSGALAITTKVELPNCQVYATDVDKNCLAVARKNAKLLKCEVKFFHGNLLEPFVGLKNENYYLKIVLANLPYVPNTWHINQAARFEPDLAIFGGDDGLDVYRQLFTQISSLENKPEVVLTESLPTQHLELANIASQVGYKQTAEQDFIQVFTY